MCSAAILVRPTLDSRPVSTDAPALGVLAPVRVADAVGLYLSPVFYRSG